MEIKVPFLLLFLICCVDAYITSVRATQLKSWLFSYPISSKVMNITFWEWFLCLLYSGYIKVCFVQIFTSQSNLLNLNYHACLVLFSHSLKWFSSSFSLFPANVLISILPHRWRCEDLFFWPPYAAAGIRTHISRICTKMRYLKSGQCYRLSYCDRGNLPKMFAQASIVL